MALSSIGRCTERSSGKNKGTPASLLGDRSSFYAIRLGQPCQERPTCNLTRKSKRDLNEASGTMRIESTGTPSTFVSQRSSTTTHQLRAILASTLQLRSTDSPVGGLAGLRRMTSKPLRLQSAALFLLSRYRNASKHDVRRNVTFALHGKCSRLRSCGFIMCDNISCLVFNVWRL
jgi:hypothetical protein